MAPFATTDVPPGLGSTGSGVKIFITECRFPVVVFVGRGDAGETAGSVEEVEAMSKYVLSFRGRSDRVATPDEATAWGQWFGELGTRVVDFGQRVGRVTALGAGQDEPEVLTGYVVIEAEDFQAAVNLAKGCPGLAYGATVEVGEPLEM
jgi:hypothetical protein